MPNLGKLNDAGSYLIRVLGCENVNTEDLRALDERLSKAQDYTKYAGTVSSVFSKDQKSSDKLMQMSNNIGKIRNPISKHYKICATLENMMQLAQAIDVLNKWSAPNSKVNPSEAAQAFDTLAGALGSLVSKIGNAVPSVASYGRIFDEISNKKFFSTFERSNNLLANARGRSLREVMDVLDEQGRVNNNSNNKLP